MPVDPEAPEAFEERDASKVRVMVEPKPRQDPPLVLNARKAESA